MQVVEFKNEFHIRTDFGRWKEIQTKAIKEITNDFGGQAARYNHEKKAWVVPAQYLVQVYGLGRKYRASHIKIGDQLPEQVDIIPTLPELETPVKLKSGKMRDYQKKGVARGLQLKRYINGDMPGLGKTLQSIATLEAAAQNGEDVFPALVMCPSALKINWSREFEQWTGRKSIILNDKVRSSWHTYYDVGMADVFIVNYESLRKYFVRKYPKAGELRTAADIDMDPRIDKFKSVVIDEIHKLKNTASQRTKIALRITRGKRYIIGLTGTPVVNKPIDLLAQLAIISKLKGFGGVEGFKARYCEGGSGASNLKELNYLLNKNCFFRREKHEVLKDLPAKIRQTISCELTEEAQKEYTKIEKDFHAFLLENDFSDKEIRKKLQAEVIVKLTLLLQLSAKGKLEAAREYIDEIVESGQKIVIFCKHKVIVDELCKIYPQAVRVTGSENELQKQASVDSFQKNPKTNIIIGSHKAAGVGLTLTAASEVLFLELPWHFADLEQCEDRCHRMGQANSVRSTSLLAEGTLDKWLYELTMEKKQIADAVTGAEDIVPVNVVDSIMKAFKK